MLEKAQGYIEAGLSVHLLFPKQKNPIAKAWSTVPNLTSRDIYEEFKEYPEANIGVRLGEFSKIDNHYLYVFDMDISSDDPMQIQEAYSKLKEIYRDYDKLPCVRSASKNSRHFYFLSKVLLKTKKIAHSEGKCYKDVNGEQKQKNNWEIDLFSTGKQLVLPPSVFNGNTYAWERNLLDYFADENKKALMIIDDISLISINLDNDTDKQSSAPSEMKSFSILEVKKALDRLPTEWHDDYENWLKVGMALHYQFSDTEEEQEAITLYDEFSKKSEKYEKNSAFKKWKSFVRQEGGVTLGTIFHHLPEETTQDRLDNFCTFLNDESVTFDSLRAKLYEIDLKDYELDSIMDLIAMGLSKSMGKKMNAVATKRIVVGLKKEIKENKENELDKLAIGLDDTLATMILKDNFNEGKNILNLNGNIFGYRNGVWVQLEMAVLEQTVLNGIKKILYSKDKQFDSIKAVIYKKKKNDDLNSLTNQITSIILKMVATPEADDILNLRNKSEIRYSVINTLNKELYIKNGKITVEDHKYDSYLITQYNVNYDPEAKAPNWNLMLNNVFQNHADKEDVIRHFKEVLGYILQSKKKDPIFLLLLGSGRNGKSFIMNQLMKIMGVDSSLSIDVTTFDNDKHASAYAVGKNMLFDDDYQKGAVLPDGTIKKYSEDKIITANPKFGKPFNYISRATPVINSNHSIKTKDTSLGLERRAQVFNFNYLFQLSEIDHNLDEKLAQERSGFLNELLDSYMAYEKRGHFQMPLSCQNSLRAWLKGSNPLMTFLDEKCIVTKDKTDTVKAQALFDRYKMYVESENCSHQLTRNNFYEDLNSISGLSVFTDSSDKNKYVRGLKLNSMIM